MKISKIGAIAGGLILAAALSLTGCSTTPGSTALITANGSEPQNPLIPAMTNENGGGKVIDNIFAGLRYYTADGTAENDLADSITTDDSQTYTIKIKSGHKFTNGEEVTSKSFADAWKYAALASNATLNAYFFEDIAGFSYDEDTDLSGLKIVDDQTFTVKLSSKLADFPLRLGYSAFYPLPSVAYKDMAAFGEHPIGNGPYELDGKDAWSHNEKIDLTVNKDYDGPRKPANGGVSIVFYATLDAAYADLQGGNLDVLDTIPDSNLKTFKADLGKRAIDQGAAIFQSITIPSSTKNYSHPDAYQHFQGAEGALRRAAISHAINREQITDVIFSGTRIPAHDFTSPVIDGYSEKLTGSDVLDFDATKAKALWAQANAISPWTGTFSISYNADGGHQGWVDAVANSIKNVLGIDAAGHPYPTFAEARTLITKNKAGKRDVQDTALRTGWQADYPGLFNFLGPLYGTGAGSNDGDYSSAAFDALLKKGNSADSAEAANKYYQQAQEVLFKDLPAIPLWYTTAQGGYGESVSSVAIDWHGIPVYYKITK